jgi:hypothetical protein
MSVLLVEETGVPRENYQTAVTGLEVFGKHQKLAHYYFNFYHFFPKFYKSEEKIKKLNIAGINTLTLNPLKPMILLLFPILT